mgnify:CR=1 FL=1
MLTPFTDVLDEVFPEAVGVSLDTTIVELKDWFMYNVKFMFASGNETLVEVLAIISWLWLSLTTTLIIVVFIFPAESLILISKECVPTERIVLFVIVPFWAILKLVLFIE